MGTQAVVKPPSPILNSWKEIANYLGCGVRTVQRYETQRGFPVHRPAGKNRTSVLAFADELDLWLQTTLNENLAAVKEATKASPGPQDRLECAKRDLEEAESRYERAVETYRRLEQFRSHQSGADKANAASELR